jgi:hypothetical protein
MDEKKVQLGSKVKDKVSGFTGTATARCERLTGVPQVLVEAQATENGSRAAEGWYDEARLEVVA